MKLTKENVYINLQGKSKEELTDLWEFLDNAGEIIFNKLGAIKRLIPEGWIYCTFYQKGWIKVYKSDLSWLEEENKQEVTIEQLKEIIKPMESLQQQLEKAKAEVKRLQSLIEEENKPKIGDWCYFYDDSNKESKVIGKLSEITNLFYTGDFNFDQCIKITNKELIKLLENE